MLVSQRREESTSKISGVSGTGECQTLKVNGEDLTDATSEEFSFGDDVKGHGRDCYVDVKQCDRVILSRLANYR